jgi:glutamine---fructose-6-phosphate transaminase (isomerizing)
MCGIIGYIGEQQAQQILLESLQRQEYRGYDSAGVVTTDGRRFNLRRSVGKLAALAELLEKSPVKGTLGIGHTRWATHGVPSEKNAHPHLAGRIAVVHNGIVENYKQIRDKLTKKGCKFKSETDTECIVQLINYYFRGDLLQATARALREVVGSFAVCVIDRENPDLMIAGRLASPLVIGIGEGENYVASDIPAILKFTRRIILLNDGDLAEVTRDGVVCRQLKDLKKVRRSPKNIEWDAEMAQKDGFPYFMLKEIFEQPRAVAETIRGRIHPDRDEVTLPDFGLTADYAKQLDRILIVACGTSYHAGMVARVAIEQTARVPVECYLSSEFRYSDPFIDKNSLVISISQSGETADTLAAVGESKRRKARVLSICNVVDSSITRVSDYVLYTQAGPEVGVASTKAFTTQVVVLGLFAMKLGLMRRKVKKAEVAKFVAALRKLPAQLKKVLKDADKIAAVGKKYKDSNSFLFLGRGINVPIAFEGALKLKEISYIHAEGYPAGEMKHGPIALIDGTLPIVCLANKIATYDKMVNNIEEVKARKGRIISLATRGDKKIAKISDDVIYVPASHPLLDPVIINLPLQLLAYYIADLRGLDVDQPRNLAKSVTVE